MKKRHLLRYRILISTVLHFRCTFQIFPQPHYIHHCSGSRLNQVTTKSQYKVENCWGGGLFVFVFSGLGFFLFVCVSLNAQEIWKVERHASTGTSREATVRGVGGTDKSCLGVNRTGRRATRSFLKTSWKLQTRNQPPWTSRRPPAVRIPTPSLNSHPGRSWEKGVCPSRVSSHNPN